MSILNMNALATVIYVALCAGLKASQTEGSLQEKYIGCYQDITAQSSWMFGIIDNNTLYIELCIETCEQLNTTYAILQNGRNCLCGDILNVGFPDDVCDTRCSGNDRQICGGSIKAASSYVIYSVCPIGFYGVGCSQTCHCKQQIPCHSVSGVCPNGCEDSWMLANCSRLTSQSLSDTDIGCYRDESERAMEHEYGYFRKTCTVEICSSYCASLNYMYAGIEVGSQCFCGDSYDKYGPRNDSLCKSTCDGDSSQSCGGNWALNVYFVCLTGYFGNGCISRCNCKNEERCACSNCTCSSGCKCGWMGRRCDIRNCSENNGDCPVNETCVTVDLKYSSVTRCSCKRGYQKSQLWDKCTAIDECEKNICERATTNCTATKDGFVCLCLIGLTRLNATHCEAVSAYPLRVVVGASVGSAVRSAVIAVVLVNLFLFCRHRQKQRSIPKRKDANRIQHQDATDAPSTERSIPTAIYETLEEERKPVDSNYTILDSLSDQSKEKKGKDD